MTRLHSLLHTFVCATALCAVVLTGCAKKVDDGKIPITTTSDEARKEFIEGRTLAENLLLTNSLEHFDKAIALDPSFAAAHLARANASGTAKEFFEHLKHAVSHADKASEGERLLILANDAGTSGNAKSQREYLEKMVTLYPNDERAHFTLGGFFFGQQEYSNAIEQYKKAIAIAPDYSPVYNILGYAYRQVENYPEAEKAFKKYTELIPNHPNPLDSYAELLMKMGKFDESITYYQKALNADPNFVASRSGVATNYMYKGMPDNAEAELAKLAEMARNDGELRTAMFTRTVLCADRGKMDEALQEVDKQYALAEKINDLAQMSGDLGLKANILLEMGKPDEALAAYERSMQLSDQSDMSQNVKDNARWFHHYNLAAVAIAKNDMKQAMAESEAFSAGAEAGKNQIQVRTAHELKGRIALAGKKYDDAIAELEQSSLQNPYNLYRLGLAYQGKGDKAKAKEYFSKAAQFNSLPGLNYAFIRTKAMKMVTGT